MKKNKKAIDNLVKSLKSTDSKVTSNAKSISNNGKNIANYGKQIVVNKKSIGSLFKTLKIISTA